MIIPAKLGLIWFMNLGRMTDGQMDRRTDDDRRQVMAKAHIAFGQVG